MLSSAAGKMKLRWEEVPGSQPQAHPPIATHMASGAKIKCPPPSPCLGSLRTWHAEDKTLPSQGSGRRDRNNLQ